MYIYADESGHTGRYIFKEPRFYFQGAIISEVDTEPILSQVTESYKKQLGVSRLHANEIQAPLVEKIAASFLHLLDDIKWVFHVTVIEKPYLAVTKFVDTFFDPYENKGARWLWYNHEFFRHTLCILFDDLLTLEDKKTFWTAYLNDDYKGVVLLIKKVLKRLSGFYIDQKLYQVAEEALSFALRYPDQITLSLNQSKKSYKGHTPNMVAFSSLIQAVHKFCKENNVAPKAFVHDSQSEFASTMREYHKLFSSVRLEHDPSGLALQGEIVHYDLGKFSMPLSKEVASLQAVDILLWTFRRIHSIKSPTLRNKLCEVTEPFYISRRCSERIIMTWSYRLSNFPLTEEQVERAKSIFEEQERIHFEELRKFSKKIKPKTGNEGRWLDSAGST